ncbi:putative transposase [Desulforapulum autotrophicum HRM2]|uniref:Transposase n=1 Tax=Desulforapulum autotrophicum (strain ATCC 43914 / DSM 3382 / VKM B-1955 / HRM2) TaxID=177437 RepID=C0QCQ0_DESAH|nr:transposase [Desulforapulum autotrophicum]ACN15127.1 putative transposase [Desulforapulum autotrophicum HRM2]
MYFTKSFITPDFMIDVLENLWLSLKDRFDPHTIVVNLDNGPENNSHRSQWIKRLIEFAKSNSVSISLAYYPPYHSKYNPIEIIWGALEKHWNGEIFDSVDKVLGLCRTMLWRGKTPVVKMIHGSYAKGVTLTKKAMAKLEQFLIRIPGIEKWAVDITGYE